MSKMLDNKNTMKTDEDRIVKSPRLIVSMHIRSFLSIIVTFMKLGVMTFNKYILILHLIIFPLSLCSYFISSNYFYLKVILKIEITPCFQIPFVEKLTFRL